MSYQALIIKPCGHPKSPWRTVIQLDIVCVGVGESSLSNPSGSTRAAIDIWRAALVEDLFDEAAGLPLYLFLEPARFEAIAERIGIDGDRRAAFARAVGDQMEWQGDQ